MDCGIISMQLIRTIPKATSSEDNKMEKCDYFQINTKRPAISQRISGKIFRRIFRRIFPNTCQNQVENISKYNVANL